MGVSALCGVAVAAATVAAHRGYQVCIIHSWFGESNFHGHGVNVLWYSVTCND